MRLREDVAKAWLRARGLPVPEGRVAATPEEASVAARTYGGHVAVKALVRAGRRGKAGAVKIAGTAQTAQAAALEILGMDVAGYRVKQVYVESAIDIATEYYLSFGFGRLTPHVAASCRGGIDIEDNSAEVIAVEIDPLKPLGTWHASSLWERAGTKSGMIPALADITVRLYEAFCDADALMLEVNPLALTVDGTLSIVGAMMEVDANALFRHPTWQESEEAEAGPDGRELNERERSVLIADRKFPGGGVRYTEVPGNIALFVAGGGAGLLQHDLMLALGGLPANHADISPAGVDKPAALFDAMFKNPATKGLLVGMNYLQMLPCTVIIKALLMSIARNHVNPQHIPIVIRVFGPEEDEARRACASVPGIHYLPHGATLEEGVREIVAAVKQLA